MTAITDLAGRAAPGRANGRPANGAGQQDRGDGAGDFATLVGAARGSALKPDAQEAAGKAVVGQAAGALAPVAPPAATSGAPASDALLATAGPATGGAIAGNPDAAASPDRPTVAPALATGQPDPDTARLASPRPRRGKFQQGGQGDASIPARLARSGNMPGGTEAAADAPSEGGDTKAVIGKPVARSPIGTIQPDGGADAGIAAAAPIAVPPQPDQNLAAASSLVALVAAQQAATPVVERRAARADRPVAQIGAAGERKAEGAAARPVAADAGARIETDAASDTQVAADARMAASAIPLPVATGGESRPDAPALPGARAAQSRAEPTGPDLTVAAAAPPRVFMMPVAQPVAGGVGDALGEAVLDMNAKGQWIDRMAQEITALAAGGGHSRFQLVPPQLGRIQVELALGDAGALVRMTTETDEAADRLRAGSAQLQADARMASLPLAGLVIDRAAAGGLDPGRDSGQNAAQQQAGQSGARNGAEPGGQSSSQSGTTQDEGRNKAQGRAAVINDRNETESVPANAPAQDRRVRFA